MRNKLFLIIIFISLITGFTALAVAEPRVLEIGYPELGGFEPTTIQQTLLPDYIKYLFNFSLIIVGLIVFAALVLGGFLYLVSAGNPTALSDAKDRIFGAVIGLVLLLSSWLILNTINPQLTIFYPLELQEVSFYQGQPGSATIFTDSCPTLISRSCTVDSDCDNGRKCFDIFANGDRKCIDEDLMISFSKIRDLMTVRFGSIYSWDDRAVSIILYGNDYEIRVCAKGGLKECKIIKNPTTDPAYCVDIDPLGLGDGKLSSFEVMTLPKGARLYEDKNFGGDYQDFPAGVEGVKCYSGGDELGRLYSAASSIEVAPYYWAILCKEPNGNCGDGRSGIVTPGWSCCPGPGDTTGYGDPNLGNNPVGNKKTRKLCVMYEKECGGAIVRTENGLTDFIPRGKQYQLGKDSIIPENSITNIIQWAPDPSGECKVKIWENSGLGPQAPSLGQSCATDESCCGRIWESSRLSGANAEIDLSEKIVPAQSCGGALFCCHPCVPGPGCCGWCNACSCNEYKYTFPLTFPDGSPAPCRCTGINPLCSIADNCCGCGILDHCCNYPKCNYDNAVHKKASCVQVIE